MKIGVYLFGDLSPSIGGNFSYYQKLVTAIDRFQFASSLEICYVGRTPQPSMHVTRKYIPLSSVKRHKRFQMLKRTRILKGATFLFGKGFDYSNQDDIKILQDNHIDVVLYPKQFFVDIEFFPFITLNWDIGHKTTYVFPEFLQSIEWRENWYRSEIQKALGIIVESEASKQECMRYALLSELKVDVVPLFAGGVIDLDIGIENQHELLLKHGIKPFTYFFYPAQFWSHKNHYHLLLALKKLRDKESNGNVRLVFTGSDGGNKTYIAKCVRELKLEEAVLDLNFVANELLYALYKNAIALVMPTFLGPTNMPILEAIALQTPVICSDFTGHREMCGEAAVYADPAEPLQWADAMAKMLDKNVRDRYVQLGKDTYERSQFKIEHAMEKLDTILLKYSRIRRTFQ